MIEMTGYRPEFPDFELNAVTNGTLDLYLEETRSLCGKKEHVDEWSVARIAVCPLIPAFSLLQVLAEYKIS